LTVDDVVFESLKHRIYQEADVENNDVVRAIVLVLGKQEIQQEDNVASCT